ncbi:PH domain-containing protein [Acinetobacter bouvetii]|uniref:PH domain-containing protein n=1 Tax=Acinetobacter bouvetii TaxID=202951 RepID=UPI00157D04FC|nr:PH domain-containing protein [Acinetobacter bouvetii]
MQKFRSKIDWWVLGFVIAMSGLLIQLIITQYYKGTWEQNLLYVLVYALTVMLIWWPLLNTRYVIDQEYLTIHSLFLTWKIKRSDIQKVSTTSNSVSSPALSLDRLKIDYLKAGSNTFVLVSPKDQSGFIQALCLEQNCK